MGFRCSIAPSVKLFSSSQYKTLGWLNFHMRLTSHFNHIEN